MNTKKKVKITEMMWRAFNHICLIAAYIFLFIYGDILMSGFLFLLVEGLDKDKEEYHDYFIEFSFYFLPFFILLSALYQHGFPATIMVVAGMLMCIRIGVDLRRAAEAQTRKKQ